MISVEELVNYTQYRIPKKEKVSKALHNCFSGRSNNVFTVGVRCGKVAQASIPVTALFQKSHEQTKPC